MRSDDFHWGFVDDDKVLNHPALQPQRGHKQLGQIEAIYPGATHTRFDHSGYGKFITHRSCDVLEKKGRLPCARNDIVQFSKLHDMGHPPFSHAVEYVLRASTDQNHHTRALTLLDSDTKDGQGRTLKQVLEIDGCDVKNLRKLFNGDPAGKICTDKTLGADKWAYTHMDAIRCGFDQLPPDWRGLIEHLTFYDGKLGVDLHRTNEQLEHQVSMLCAMQNFYFRIYTEVYLSPQSMVYERHIQKALEFAIRARVVDPHAVWDMSDGELEGHINKCQPSRGKNGQAKLAREALLGYSRRSPYVSAVAFKYGKFTKDHLQGEKVVPITPQFGGAFLETFENPFRLTKLETALEEEFKVPMLVCVIPDAQKVKPEDVPLYEHGKLTGMLSEMVPAHYASLREMARRFFSIRIHVQPSEREAIVRKYKAVSSFFHEITEDYFKRNSEKK